MRIIKQHFRTGNLVVSADVRINKYNRIILGVEFTPLLVALAGLATRLTSVGGITNDHTTSSSKERNQSIILNEE